jgi:hypothetical protein
VGGLAGQTAVGGAEGRDFAEDPRLQDRQSRDFVQSPGERVPGGLMAGDQQRDEQRGQAVVAAVGDIGVGEQPFHQRSFPLALAQLPLPVELAHAVDDGAHELPRGVHCLPETRAAAGRRSSQGG